MERALTPEEIRGADFRVALLGYDRQQVQAFLQQVAAETARLKESSTKSYQAAGVELGQLLQQAKDLADKLLSDAESEAATLVQTATTQAAELREDADAYAKQVRDQVDAEAENSRAQADQAYAKRISSADDKVRELSIAESETRQRLSALRVELEKVANGLLQLGPDDPPPAEIQKSLEDEEIVRLDREDTIPQEAVVAPRLGST